MQTVPDERGKFGPYGGQFVPETLMPALEELIAAYEDARHDPAFVAEFEGLLSSYVGRPSPLTHAKRLSERLGGAQIYPSVLPVANRIYFTRVHAKPEGDRTFPDPDPAEWRETAREELPMGPKDDHAATLIIYERAAAPAG